MHRVFEGFRPRIVDLEKEKEINKFQQPKMTFIFTGKEVHF